MALESAAGYLIAGVYGFYGNADLSASSSLNSGSSDSDGWGAAATLTYYNPLGLYADFQVQRAWFDTDLNLNTGPLADGNKGLGIAASSELGWNIYFGNNFTASPQLQYVYSDVRFNGFTATDGESVVLDTATSERLRLGLALRQRFAVSDAGEGLVYANANAFREFDPTVGVYVADVMQRSVVDRWSGELGAGGAVEWNNNGVQGAVFGEVSVENGLAGLFGDGLLGLAGGSSQFTDNRALKGSVGVRVKY